MKTHMLDKMMGLALALVVTVMPTPVTADTVTTSWYGKRWDGRYTANGEIFNHRKWTVAHRTLPMGTQIVIKHGKRKVVARVNDRGPYVRGRSLDVSQAVADRLNIRHKGVARVQIRVLKNRLTR